MLENKKVSIIVPIYNCEVYIEKCLESLIFQSYENLEILLVNDGSKDKSKQVIDKYLKKDNRIHYFYQKNEGPSQARNKGLSHATGEYIMFVDADDTVNQDYVSTLVNKLEKEKVDLVCCGYYDNSIHGVRQHHDFLLNSPEDTKMIMNLVCQGTGGVLWGKIFKRYIIFQNNIQMDKNLYMSEDLVFVLQYVSFCNSFGIVDDYLYNYNRINPGSISANISMSYIQNYIQVCQTIEQILRQAGIAEKKIEKVIRKRMQVFILQIVEQQSIAVAQQTLKDAEVNIRKLLTNYYIKKNLAGFSAETFIERPTIYLLKKQYIMPVIGYLILTNRLKTIKKRINRKGKHVIA